MAKPGRKPNGARITCGVRWSSREVIDWLNLHKVMIQKAALGQLTHSELYNFVDDIALLSRLKCYMLTEDLPGEPVIVEHKE